MTKISAGVVLYNPNIERLINCLDSLYMQLDEIIVYDNSIIEIDQEIRFYLQSKKVIYISENKNCGIAYALNKIMEYAKSINCGWVVTMDQDSILPSGFINELKNIINTQKNESLGIICPQVIDKRRLYMKAISTPSVEYISDAITSGSCTSIIAWEKVGKFDEFLFIDLVDNDFSKRLVCSGFKILRLNKYILDQEFGEILPKPHIIQKFYIGLGKLLKNNNIKKFSYRKNVVPLRVYYTSRNIIYVNRKLKKYGNTAYHNYNCKNYFGFIFAFLVPSLIRGRNKKAILKAILKGTLDGYKTLVTPWEHSN